MRSPARCHQLLELRPTCLRLLRNRGQTTLIDATRDAHVFYKSAKGCEDLLLAFLQILESGKILPAESRKLFLKDSLKVSSLFTGG